MAEPNTDAVAVAQRSFALFVTSVAADPETGEGGHIVPRFGLRDVYIGARRPPLEQSDEEARERSLRGKPKGATGWIWSTEIEAISHAEYAKYRREYDGMIKDGSLEKHTAEEYVAEVSKLQANAEAKVKEAEEAAAKAAKEAADAAKKAEAEQLAAERKAKAEADAKARAEAAKHSLKPPTPEESGR